MRDKIEETSQTVGQKIEIFKRRKNNLKRTHGIRAQDPTFNSQKLEKHKREEIGEEIITQFFKNFPKSEAHKFPDGKSKRVPSTMNF